MQQIKLLLLSVFFALVIAGCSDHGHSHDDNSSDDNSQKQTTTKHDSIN